MPPHPDAAALIAVQAELERVTDRVVAIADRHRDDPDDTLTPQLDDLERAVRAAARRLDRIIRTL
jgi:hypothetical protein